MHSLWFKNFTTLSLLIRALDFGSSVVDIFHLYGEPASTAVFVEFLNLGEALGFYYV